MHSQVQGTPVRRLRLKLKITYVIKIIFGAGLDVLDYESSSFNSVFNSNKEMNSLNFLIEAEQVILSPHVGGWTVESHQKLAKTILNKILNLRII